MRPFTPLRSQRWSRSCKDSPVCEPCGPIFLNPLQREPCVAQQKHLRMPSTCLLQHSASKLPSGQHLRLGIRDAMRLNLTAPALGDAAPGRHVCWVQGDVDIVVWDQKQGHIGEDGANANWLDIGGGSWAGALGCQSSAGAREGVLRPARGEMPA